MNDRLKPFALIPALVAVMVALGGPAAAQDARANRPGQFDFYVLSLSWSPSFCAAAVERGRVPQQECGGRAYGFVVHGLWPQYENGFPESCEVPPPRLDRRIVAPMLDVMPSSRLVYSEWDRHGTCSGLDAAAYFATLRRAAAAVKIPPAYVAPKQLLRLAPAAMEDSFIKANPGLARGEIAVACSGRWLTEVRFCLTKDLKFRACAQVARRSCRRDEVLMPPR